MTLRCYHFSKQLTQPQKQTIDPNQSNESRLRRMITFKTNNFAFVPIRRSPKGMANSGARDIHLPHTAPKYHTPEFTSLKTQLPLIALAMNILY